MTEHFTIRDALLELRRLVQATKEAAQTNAQLVADLVARAQDGTEAADKATVALDRITSQLGFSVALERAASDEQSSAFPGGAKTESDEEGDEEKPRRRRRRQRTRSTRDELNELAVKIVSLRRDGLTHREIAKRLNIGHATVWRELAKLPQDPIQNEAEEEEKVEETVVQDADPRFRFKLKGELVGAEVKMFNLLKKNYPDFTTASEFTKKHVIGNDNVATATITRLRRKDVPVESAKQARERGEDIDEGVTGWRLIVDE